MTAQPGGEHEHRIVVGVDGSVTSKAALRWAARQARLAGAVVEAVTAWEVPAISGYPVPVRDVDWEELATQIVTDAIAEIAATAEPTEIRYKVAKGNAAQVLLDASADADLLWSAAAATAASWRRCWDLPGGIAPITRPAQW